ncbi:MAG: radical SAM protein [archaeon]|nr:radical SAM protein [archaeon]
MSKTQFGSYCMNDIPEGCKRCVRGEKLVLFISGKCSRNCYYCSLSKKRKEVDEIWANERQCSSPENAIEEAKESNAKGAGITGGDPLLCLDRTIEYARALKSAFKDFHIHIYLPTTLMNRENLERINPYVDEVRVHPSFLQAFSKEASETIMKEDIKKIEIASEIFKKENLGIEIPIIPEKKEEIIEFVKRVSCLISFINMNELELSETNFDIFTEKYSFNEDTHTVSGSVSVGTEIMKSLRKINPALKVHLCTDYLKSNYQFGNRLRKHNILPFGFQDKEGMANYFAVYCKNEEELKEAEGKLKLEKRTDFYIDIPKKRIILSEKLAEHLIKNKRYKITKVTEYPTFDKTEVESSPIN